MARTVMQQSEECVFVLTCLYRSDCKKIHQFYGENSLGREVKEAVEFPENSKSL